MAAGAPLFLLLHERETFVSQRRAEPDAYLLDIRQMTGTDEHIMALQTGETLHIRFTCTSGSLRLDITAPVERLFTAAMGRQPPASPLPRRTAVFIPSSSPPAAQQA